MGQPRDVDRAERRGVAPCAESLWRASLFFTIVALVVVGLSSCVDVDGGGVEGAWLVRTPDAVAVGRCGCGDPAIKWVDIVVQGVSPNSVQGTTPCAGKSACRFACDSGGGVTPLNIPPGNYLISLRPLDESGNELKGAVQVPDPILRTVQWGQATDLGALQIRVPCSASCSRFGDVNNLSACND